jgi:cytochrome c biogenesis protein CcdA
MIQFFFAFLAGIVTIAGPCILPLLPIILGTSTKRGHASRPIFIILGFILSFTVFVILFATVGRALNIDTGLFRSIAAVLIGLFGIMMLFPDLQTKIFAKLEPILAKTSPKRDPNQSGLWSGFLLGTSLGLVWSPCAGPILGSILTLVAANQSLVQSGALLFAYSLGAGIPMLAIAYGGQAATTKVRAIAKHAPTIQRVFGVIIILVAIAIYTGLEANFQAWLITNYPWLFPNLNLGL